MNTFHDFLNETKKYKKQFFVSVPVKEGDVLYDYDNGKPGYYNYRLIQKINGNNVTIVIVDRFNGTNHIKSEPYDVSLSTVQKWSDTVNTERHNKQETVNEIVHEISVGIKLSKIKGGDLSNDKVLNELITTLKNLKSYAEKYKTGDSSIPAGGFSGANSGTMSSSRSGKPISVEFNNVHRGGYYDFSRYFIVQIKVGGGLEYNYQEALLKVSKELLKNYTFNTNLGNSSISDSDGTNWSSIMLSAPTKDNYHSVLKSLDTVQI